MRNERGQDSVAEDKVLLVAGLQEGINQPMMIVGSSCINF